MKKNYPDGVWTLPPRLVKKELNKDKYLSIGESDRMTLKFIKIKNYKIQIKPDSYLKHHPFFQPFPTYLFCYPLL